MKKLLFENILTRRNNLFNLFCHRDFAIRDDFVNPDWTKYV